ncbi:MAG TPA: hypothetical protein VGZ50_04410 [Actinomycetota bacterium]|nr:hypothetical protein [Actinomycetota bacterium]
MVSTVLMSAILFAVAAIVMTRNVSDYNQVRSDRRFEQAIQVADSGVDHMLYKVGATPSYSTGEELPPEYMGPNVDRDAEKVWVLDQIDGTNPLVTTPEGQWATIRPSNADVIYSVGYVPTQANPFKVRIIRAAYDYAPFVPSVAILTDGNLQIGGSATITGAGGSVHANGDVLYGGSPSVSGYVSAAGDCTGCGSPTIGDPANSGGGKPKREVPLINPRENYVMSEYDLCPNGEVRTGPSYSVSDGKAPNTSGVPCGGTLLGTGEGQGYRGWKTQYPPPPPPILWTYNDQTPYNGVYYIYQGSAHVTGSPGNPTTPWQVTIFTEAISSGDEPGHCPHLGGDIDMAGGGTVRPNSKAQPLHLVAGRDLQMSGTPGNKWEGVYAAHEQFQLTGNVEMNGVILANDYCDTPGSPVSQNIINVGGSAKINYDGGLEVPLGRRIRTTHWNEL